MDALAIVEMILLVTYVLTGISGNVIIIYIYGVKKIRKISTDYLIVALGVADLVASACLIAVVTWTIEDGFRSDDGCKLVMYIRRCGAVTSVAFTTLLSCDRFLIVCQPLSKRPSLNIYIVAILVCVIYTAVSQISYPLFAKAIDVSDSTACALVGPVWLGLANGIHYNILLGIATLTCTLMYSKIYLKIKHHRRVGSDSRGQDEAKGDDKSRSLWSHSKRSVLSRNRIAPEDSNYPSCSASDMLSGHERAVSTLVEEPSTEVITKALPPGVYFETTSSPPIGPICQMSELESHKNFGQQDSANNCKDSPSGETRCDVLNMDKQEKVLSEPDSTSPFGPFLDETVAASSSIPGNQKTSPSNLGIANEGPRKNSHRTFKSKDSRVLVFKDKQGQGEMSEPERHVDKATSLKRRFSKLALSRTGTNHRPRKDAMTRMLLITTAIFFFTSVPAIIFENLPLALVKSFRSSYAGDCTVVLLYHIRLINHVINVFVYLIVNSRFRKDMRNIFCKRSEE
ncbi:D(2) dopamine receptor-like [Strongylocentrotus purpuratus]|uniref:G-protein coupled receptors family 1 profile domain-containing protein n=1 Tax=Strongylocentrotus purpuratus TaxID=7668 RepID=A0A7M7G9W8_STRPU|nr:D(2) dopamine receptor-like [Strongylocentrotus purpuratus]